MLKTTIQAGVLLGAAFGFAAPALAEEKQQPEKDQCLSYFTGELRSNQTDKRDVVPGLKGKCAISKEADGKSCIYELVQNENGKGFTLKPHCS